MPTKPSIIVLPFVNLSNDPEQEYFSDGVTEDITNFLSRLSGLFVIDSLKPGQPGSLKVKPDGTVMDGHHRIRILRDRGVEVDLLPREILS